MPFFGKETGPNSVRINGYSQFVMDEEIACAAQAGLAYWAFCSYAPSDPLSNALHLYLSSIRRSEIGFCLITGLESNIEYFKKQTEYQIKMMKEPGYMKVLDGRPLFYVMAISDEQIARDGGIPKIREWVQYIRKEMQKSGQGNPYFVLLEGHTDRAVTFCHDLQLDAIGRYATAVGPFGGAPYSTLVQNTESSWDKLAATGLNVVPNVMTGWDSRPRFKNPTPWDKAPSGKAPVDHHYQEGKPVEIEQHLAASMRWIKDHPTQSPANTALIYAWNECDEGFGALVPTYDPANLHGNTDRIKAVANILKNK